MTKTGFFLDLTYRSLSNDIFVSIVFKKYKGGGLPYPSENEGGFCPPPSYLRGGGGACVLPF